MSGNGVAAGNGRVADILDRSLAGERLTDDDALVLLRTRDLVRVGRAADELRNRKVDPKRVTFIIDRNVNYTNICHTDCDFCAFYRRPGDRKEGYLLPSRSSSRRSRRPWPSEGRRLMQGGHHPDLGVDFYEDLFRSIKEPLQLTYTPFAPRSSTSHALRSSRSRRRSHACDAGLDFPGRRDPRRPGARHHRSEEDEVGRVARGHAGRSPPRRLLDGDDDVRARRETRGAGRAHAQDPRAPGRDRRLPRLHLLDVPTGGTRLAGKVSDHPTSFDYLLTQAVSRLYLDNVDHIQSSWVTQG